MRGISLAKFLAVTLVIAILAYIAYIGVPIYKTSLGAKYVKQGLDLKGGLYIVYQPEIDKDKISDSQLATAKEVLRKRLDSMGYYDASATVDQTNKRLVVEIPDVKDAGKVVNDLAVKAKLQFKDPDGKIIVEGNEVVNALADKEQTGLGQNQWVVKLEFSPEGNKKFAEATDRVSKLAAQNKNYISIYLDEVMLSSPSVRERIDGGGFIEGGFTSETAKVLAAQIRAGALPFALKDVQHDVIGPTLGQQALKISLMAGAVAFALISVFMLLWYRLPGLVAIISLMAYTAVTILILSALKNYIALTLPGIAGIILSIGMAVDANIIIFERLKEELRAGKTLRGAVETGFKRAFTTILDANLTTVIVGVVLYLLGTGPIRGFAITLVLGVILSFVSAITLTRYMLIQAMGLGLRQRWLYGHKGGAVNA